MGIISLEKADNLYWLGRYSERVYTTSHRYFTSFDIMLDQNEEYYMRYCEALNIPDIYVDSKDFVQRYAFDTENTDSIISNLYRAYDNALVVRDYISSESLAYIQMAIYEMKKAKANIDAPLIAMQRSVDNILACWGCIDDVVYDVVIRNIIKYGRRQERLDLLLRLRGSRTDLKRIFSELEFYLYRSNLKFNRCAFLELALILEQDIIDYPKALDCLEKIVVL
ncbi:MAG: alpha-E domain-containing protein [Lachnospiraceae bacterium]|nr:alpha-E domain-containing protein [Lachnospiraceae bacterium]MBP3507401.1 alpha-E domain-containing protein [Lachnospiraceae bacterium]